MKINFFLPGIGMKITGGYKVVYQYANFLSDKGNEVTIYYDINNGKNNKHIPCWIMRWIKLRLIKKYPYYWFKLNKKIKQNVIMTINNENVENADISIATAFRTSKAVNELTDDKGKKIYFIQDYEEWGNTTKNMLVESYRYSMKKIVVSNWLKEIVDQYSKEKAIVVSNGIDIDNVFKCSNCIENRNNYSIIMLYHKEKRKGCEYGLEIIKRLKNEFPELQVQLFGFPDRDSNIPEWVKYKQDANEMDVAKLMNENAIYMCTSLQEGFGLPGLEAMACGCALITTDCKGVLEYANHENSLISRIDDFEEMLNNVRELLNNKERRIMIAKNGLKTVKTKSINIKCDEFKKAIMQ